MENVGVGAAPTELVFHVLVPSDQSPPWLYTGSAAHAVCDRGAVLWVVPSQNPVFRAGDGRIWPDRSSSAERGDLVVLNLDVVGQWPSDSRLRIALSSPTETAVSTRHVGIQCDAVAYHLWKAGLAKPEECWERSIVRCDSLADIAWAYGRVFANAERISELSELHVQVALAAVAARLGRVVHGGE